MYKENNKKVVALLEFFKNMKIKAILWGLGANGMEFLEEFDPKAEYIAYVVDIDRRKQGKMLKTGHLVKSSDDIDMDAFIIVPDNICPSICMDFMSKGKAAYKLNLIPIASYINDMITLNSIRLGLPWKGKRFYD